MKPTAASCAWRRRDRAAGPVTPVAGAACGPDRATRAAALRGFFALSLDFAAVMMDRAGIGLEEALLRFTCLHRRFGMGDPEQGTGPGWGSFLAGLEARPDDLARLDWVEAFYLSAPEERRPEGLRFFGCLGHAPPDAAGVVRLHFRAEGDVLSGCGPLDRSALDRRRAELAALVAGLRRDHPQARRIAGLSWLYHLPAYRRIFPAGYGDSAHPAGPVRLSGMSSWGQMLTHRGALKPEMAAAFRRNWDRLDPARPWLAFPMPALAASAPVSLFGINARNAGAVPGDHRAASPY